jgi:hypothetical protein
MVVAIFVNPALVCEIVSTIMVIIHQHPVSKRPVLITLAYFGRIVIDPLNQKRLPIHKQSPSV